MKKKFKNKELEEILSNVAQLGTYPMPGNITLAVISARKELKIALDNYNDACRLIGESRCLKDTFGNPVSVFLEDEHGNVLLHYPKKLKFASEQDETSALQEVKKLGEQEIEIDLKEIPLSIIEDLKNITPVQMEALSSLLVISEN